VKNSSATYQRFTKVTAALLLMAFLIPTGLHAKDLVEFCKMEFGSVPAETAGIPADEMKAGHSCCESGDEEPSQDHAHHDCEWKFICACSIGESTLSDWTVSTNDAYVILTESVNLALFKSDSETIPDSENKQLAQHDPPLWLVYDTFLH
jgi:hypothetical protein